EHRLRDGPAALRHHRVDGDLAREGYADEAGAVHAVAEVERVVARRAAAARDPADRPASGEVAIQAAHEAFDVERERIGEHDEVRTAVGRRADELAPRLGAAA